jgi:monoamine oxidase
LDPTLYFKDDCGMDYTRRQFLNKVGAVAGSGTAYQLSALLGLTPSLAAATPKTKLAALSGDPVRVVILGAGISGLVCAYELERAGYECTLIEASTRIGGRNYTVRGGDVIDEMGHRQVCEFDTHSNLYFNAGPARIAAQHRLLLDYCQELEVPLEYFMDGNRQAWAHDPDANDGKPIRAGEYIASARGFMTELVAKSIKKGEFDKGFSDEDAELIFEYMKSYGDLKPDGSFGGSSRAGYLSGGMTEPATYKTPLDFQALFSHFFWKSRMSDTEGWDLCAPMMQAVGGNDNIVKGFVRNIKSEIITNAPVQSIMQDADGVAVAYLRDGAMQKIEADYCMTSIPAHLLPGIKNNFSPDYLAGLSSLGRGKLMKIALQMKERFWEREAIYGGITWTNQTVEQIWYPSQGINDKKGVVLGAYPFEDENQMALIRMTPQQRIDTAVEQGSKIHPDYADYVESGVSVPWYRMNFMLGCGAEWSEQARDQYFRLLQAPDRRHYLIGDQISFHTSWQEGAVSSAHHALSHLNQRVSATRSA